MNSWDEDPDELLRQRWQQTFANFEVQAHPSLGGRILNSIPAGRPRRRAYRMMGLLLLTSIGLLYPLPLEERPYSGSNAITVRRTAPIRTLSDGRIRPSETSTDRSVSVRLPRSGSRPEESAVHQQPALNPPTATNSVASRVSLPADNRTTRKPSSTEQARFRSRPGSHLRATPIPNDPSLAKSAPTGGFPSSVNLSGPARTIRRGSEFVPVAWSVNDSPGLLAPLHPITRLALNDALPVAWDLLKPLGVKRLANGLTGQLPVADLAVVHPTQAAGARSRPRWFLEAVPQSSFQWMRTPPASAAYLSPVSAPGAFSPATWGYQINGGIRFRRWQAYLSTGQLRRWAYYTVNENRYRVEPSPTDPHQLVRETESVAENVALPMIGAGLSQQTLLAQGRYAVDLGGQVSYLPTSDQALLGLRGGAGRRLLLSRHTELQAGLTVEYGLNRLLSERQHLLIHPLMVGIRLRIQPRSTR
jgi:hypothetical protein